MSKAELVKEMVKSVKGISTKDIIIDAHSHIFNYDCIAKELTERYTMNINPNRVAEFIGMFNDCLNDDRKVARLSKFLDIGAEPNTKKIAGKFLKESKFKGSKRQLVFTLLMMDTEYAAKDRSDADQLPKKIFVQQKEEMTEVALEHPGVFLPFIAADPRRIRDNKNTDDPKGIKYITDALEKDGFWGVKIYPPLGYMPDDFSLRPLYKYCEDNGIPITAHCLHGGFFSDQKVPKNKKPEKNKHYWAMANPENWKPVLDRYPRLKLNLGHFGGDIFGMKGLIYKRKDKTQIRIEKEWRKTIEGYLKQYDNVYADLAYIEAMFNEPDAYFKRLKKYSDNDKIWCKILYGTDWWANRTLCSESEHLEIFSDYTKNQGIRKSQITRLLKGNAVKFLGLNNPTSGPLFNHINFLAGKGKKLPTWFKFS